MSAFRILLKKELTDSLRDRRTLVMMIVLPIFLYPGLLGLVAVGTAAGRRWLAAEQLVVGVTSAEAEEWVNKRPPPENTRFVRVELEEGKAALREKKLGALVTARPGSLQRVREGEQGKLEILFTKRNDRSVEALERMRKHLKAIAGDVLAIRLEGSGLAASFAEPVRADEIDVDFASNLGPFMAARLLPVLLVVMLFMGALYPAVDVTAGEKERGTLETLLVAPVRPMEIMAAKYVTVAVISVCATLANLAAMASTFWIGIDLDGGGSVQMQLGLGQLLLLLGVLIPAAALAAAVALAVASLARSFKEAQTLLTPVSLIGTVPGIVALMPGVELTPLTAAIPLVNVALLVKAAILGNAQPLATAIVLLSVLGLAALAIWAAANAFRSEARRFGGTESWRELFRLR